MRFKDDSIETAFWEALGVSGREEGETLLAPSTSNTNIGQPKCVDPSLQTLALEKTSTDQYDKIPQLYKCEKYNLWEHIPMYEIEDLDSSEQFVLLCGTCAYIFIGSDADDTPDQDEEICKQIAEAMKAGAGGVNPVNDVPLKVVRETRDATTPVWEEFMDAFEEGL